MKFLHITKAELLAVSDQCRICAFQKCHLSALWVYAMSKPVRNGSPSAKDIKSGRLRRSARSQQYEEHVCHQRVWNI